MYELIMRNNIWHALFLCCGAMRLWVPCKQDISRIFLTVTSENVPSIESGGGNEGPDQPALMRRLIWACVVRKLHKGPFRVLRSRWQYFSYWPFQGESFVAALLFLCIGGYYVVSVLLLSVPHLSFFWCLEKLCFVIVTFPRYLP